MTITLEAPAAAVAAPAKPAKPAKPRKPLVVTTDKLRRMRAEYDESIQSDKRWNNPSRNDEFRSTLIGQITRAQKPLDEAIEAALAQVNGRAQAHTISDAVTLRNAVAEAEKRLDAAGIPKTDRAGIRIEYRPAGPQARAYKYAAKTTWVLIERRSADWALIDIQSDEVSPTAPQLLNIHIDERRAELVRQHAMRPFRVAA